MFQYVQYLIHSYFCWKKIEMQKLLTFFQKNISICSINDQSFNDMLTDNIVSFKQLGPGLCSSFI